ncbi:hypothetical protein BGP82_00350 [Pseudomonas putida]|uniref:Uncharacterized protein n=1 Tax=Pseudomonas putida TaxID=303 RepID=A0A2S3XBL3_PSEPU|nr:hypothetical protein [Pseudomonas putida]POG12950.1 hypothetical protein BGP82_00350 [Pseudomonas putida]
MTMKEEVAQLTGTLKFNVESSGFQRFSNMMKNANKVMQNFAQNFENLSRSLSKGLKLKIDTTAVDKAKAKLDTALKRQQRAEAALSNQQRQTFAAELTQQKLKYAGAKAQAHLNNAMLQSQKDAAVVAAKAAAAQAKATGTSKTQLASQNALTASLTRQAKLEAILLKTRQTTQKANNQHLASMTKLQRIQQQMNHAQQQAHIRAQKHATQMAAAQQTAANKTTAQFQRDQRFQAFQQRHAAWQARQNAPTGGMFGGMGMTPMLAFGGVGAAIAGLSVAMAKLGERIENRKSGVVDAERFDAAFVGLGKSPETRKLWKDTFLSLSTESGAEISNETAEDFRTFVGMQQAFGKTTDQITKEYKLRQQAFTVAGLTKDSSREVNRQLNQVSTDGLGDKSDWNVLSERMPMLVPYVTRAFGEEEKIKDPVKAVGAFNKRMKKGGGVKLDWITKGMETMVAENQAIFESKKNSVGFAKTLQENQEFLNAVGINNTQELNAVMRDNVQAHKELNDALQPAAKLLRDFDAGLTQAQTGLIRFTIGRNADGSEKTSAEKAMDMATRGFNIEAPSIDPGALTGKTPQYDPNQSAIAAEKDPVNRFWKWLFNKKTDVSQAVPQDYLGSADSSSTALMPGIVPKLQLKVPDAPSDSLSKFKIGFGAFADNINALQTVMADSTSKALQGAVTSNSNNQVTVNVAGDTFNFDTTGLPSAAEQEAWADQFTQHKRDLPGLIKEEVQGLFRGEVGKMRSQQAER